MIVRVWGNRQAEEISPLELEDLLCNTKKFELYPAGQEEPMKSFKQRSNIIKIVF